ncbi:MAG: peptidylprolyl isomerase [Paludibacter sp.]|nr:peptidylprolyl isomerase [Bacteroidales bacterium]MCM1069175.1 peptidylprolyl isomerase [Prevotella sp.]MCM1354080.1 peptidylprolyl isomerase [Bacteroides sp.]MCM1442947.1 peptidylprolyl isomerase [Muribaculum sp.]MCM1481730.1 peptidylprolyl isomerase [Paludibacter sp.]
MKKLSLAVTLLITAATLAAQLPDTRVLLTINGEPSTVEEFMYIYQKNNQETQVEQKTINEYLELFINFKLKVKAAEQLGIDTTEAFLKELAGYRKQATPKYMVDPEAEEAAIQKAYGRMLNDRRVSHIAIKCPANATPEEEAAAIEKINRAYTRVTTGLPVVVRRKTLPGTPEDFAIVAAEMSEDPSVADNGGMIGWVRPFRFVYPFEEQAYNTEVGHISNVFRTPFGFHILKVEEERPHLEVHAAHIMKMTPRGNDSVCAAAKQQIDSLYNILLAGEDFTTIAIQNSDDRGSAQRGGDLGWFGKGQMVPAFEDAAFAIEQEGTLSQPVQSVYGWHIIKLLERRGTPDLADIRDEVIKNIRRSEYQQEIDNAFVEKLKQDYNFTQNTEALAPIYNLAADYDVRDSVFMAAAAQLNDVLFRYADEYRTQADFAAYLRQNTFVQQLPTKAVIDDNYQRYVARELRAHEESLLEDKYPELRNLMTEYHDGILLFEVSLREVWDKAGQDTAGITAFFNAHRKDYTWDTPRYKGYVVYCKDKTTAKAAKRIIQSANADSVASYINNRLNLDSVQYVRFEKGLWKQGDNPAVDKYAFKKGNYQPEEEFPYVFVIGKQLKGAEVYTDERGKVTSAYQDYLEQEWVKALRQEYNVVIDEDVLHTLTASETAE